LLGTLEASDADDMFPTLVGLAAQSGLIPSIDTLARSSPHAFERVLVTALTETATTTSIGGTLANQVRACGEIRDRLSTDHWRTILAARNDFRDALARLGLTSPEAARDYDRVTLSGALEHLATQLLAISGAQGDRMTRDEAWRMIFIGRMIERVSTMATFLRVFAAKGTLSHPAGFDLLLQLFDSTLTYRSLYPGRLVAAALIDLIVVDPTNPRGLYGVLSRLRKKLDEMVKTAGAARRAHFTGIALEFDTLPSLDALCEADEAGRFGTLVALCDRLLTSVSAASNEVSAYYFSHANSVAAQVS
jgi:uncharacterized alpha-E superfamily protein